MFSVTRHRIKMNFEHSLFLGVISKLLVFPLAHTALAGASHQFSPADSEPAKSWFLLGWWTRFCPISCFDVDTRITGFQFQFILYLVSLSVCAELVVSAASDEAHPMCVVRTPTVRGVSLLALQHRFSLWGFFITAYT